MASIREQIMQALVGVLAGTAGVGTNIFRSRQTALGRQDGNALLLEYDGDDSPQNLLGNRVDKTMNVKVSAVVRGEVPDQLADPILVSAHSKIMADTRLGGLSVNIDEDATTPDMEDADGGGAALITTTYRVQYRTQANNLEQTG